MLLLLLSCAAEEPRVEVAPVTSLEAQAAALEAICEAAAHTPWTCVAEEAHATFGDHRLEVAAGVAEFVTLEGRTIGMGSSAQQLPGEVQLVLELGLKVDGAELMTLEVAEAASDVDLEVAKDKALDEAIRKWMVGHGLAVLDALTQDADSSALGAVGMKAAPQTSGAFRAWAAYPMLRGHAVDPQVASRMGPGVESMLAALGPYLETLEPGTLHTVHVHAKLGGTGGPGRCGVLPPIGLSDGATASIVPLRGEVLVDGEATGTICELSEQVAWPLPPGGTELEWEQFIVVR